MADPLRNENVDPNEIKGIGVDTCCTVVLLDDDMNPLRDALLWMNVRASREAQFIAENGHKNVSA